MSVVVRMVVLGLLASALTALGLSAATGAIITHGALVPEEAAGGYPKILRTPLYVPDGTPIYNNPQPRETRAVTQTGRTIVSGGDFWQIELKDGTVIDQPYFAAWNIDTKAMTCEQKFVFDNNVTAVEPGPTPTQVYVAGRFAKITGANGVAKSRTRLALLDLSNCSVVDKFKSPNPNGVVREILYRNGRLFVGGDFTKIGGLTLETVSELNPTTGAVLPAMNFTTTGELTSRVHALEMNDAGTRLYLGGRFGTITGTGGTAYAPMAIINISNPAAPSLTAHRLTGMTNTQGSSLSIADLQDMALDPTRGNYALAYGTATVSDYVYYASTTEAPVTPLWRHYMRDSSFGVAVTDAAVYVTGHFCRPDAGPGASEVLEPKLGLDTCTGTSTSGGVWRSHMAALSRTDGTPLNWNPGQSSFTGGTTIEAVKRGLLVGFDGEWTGGVRTGTTAFLDFGAGVEDVAPPSVVTFTSPTAGGSLNTPATLTGLATDDAGVVEYRMRIKSATGQFLQADGTLGATNYAFKLTPADDGSFKLDTPLPAGSYTAEAWAIDLAGRLSPTNTEVAFTGTGLDGVAPVTVLTLPSNSSPEAPVVVRGVTTDTVSVSDLKLRVQNAAGQYLQASGGFGTTVANLSYDVTEGALGTGTLSWSRDLGVLPVGTYTVTARGTDARPNVKNYTGTFTVAVTPPTVSITSPVTSLQSGTAFDIAGAAADNFQVSSVAVRVSNAAGNFLRADGSFAAGSFDLPANVTGLGTASASFSYGAGVLAPGDYTVTVVVTDPAGGSTSATRVVNVKSQPVPSLTSYSPGGGTTGNYVVGYRFSVNVATPVTALGLYDYDNDGKNDNNQNTTVAIYRTDTKAMVASAVVPAAATAENRWFYTNLAAPVTLQPGITYTVVSQHWLFGEYVGLNGTATRDSRLTIAGYAYANGSTMTYPTLQSTSGMYGAPNMKFAAP
ncbi:hypothetical protein [Nocardioides sp.]|uniref:hypothetical protein n=1 Tax=Nocardioides sp. TaxID=35761 RepID=UPI003D0ADA9F